MSTGQLPSGPRSFRLQGDFPDNWNAADLQKHLGGIPLQRIRLIPPPGCASEDDVIRLHDVEHRLCELLDGILDLIIEVRSDGNTDDEMAAKLRVYQQAGVRMIWYINPKSSDAVCHRSAGESTYIARDGVLDGEDVLPDFQLSLSELFARADQQRPAEE